MINRTLARSAVFQELYAFYHAGCQSAEEAVSSLEENLHTTQGLYYYLFALIPALSDLYAEQIDRNRRRFFLREEDANPNMLLVENRLVEAIRSSDFLQEQLGAIPHLWQESDTILRPLLDEILASPIYRAYTQEGGDDFAGDVQFWIDVLQKHTFRNPLIDEYLADCSIYWGNPSHVTEKIELEEMLPIDQLDEMLPSLRETPGYSAVRLVTSPVEVQKDFMLKSLRRAKNLGSLEAGLLPMFKDEEDEQFPILLIRSAIIHAEKYRELIDAVLENWDSERLADSDVLLLQQGIAELLTFPSIEAKVTLNEYIELARVFSTSKSDSFVNALLDAVLTNLRTDGLVKK